MNQENIIDDYSYEYNDIKAENVIFQAYLSAFFRHKSYICKLYKTGKIGKFQATERISMAWEKLKLIKKRLEYPVNYHNYDANTQFYLVKASNFCLESENELGLWN
ncbi:MAG: hypothetical protein RMX68_001775 [Aulosira sp. ZfuVER01]|nr:hypothetical protein [Aulosira sp. ZfuVER01]MDZ8001686.1 hypothetical protein [Aulosira sp. DedVER01a]MDZ8055212.1 hypothetical protein [Aulosira sp. ZfuCHP01]